MDNWYPVERVARVLKDVAFQWWIAGGTALDLFVGRTLRQHSDTDVAVLRREQERVREHLASWDLQVVVAPGVLEPWTDKLSPSQFGVWCRREPEAPWAFELLFEDTSESEWMYRRDHSVTSPLRDVGRRTASGTPYLVPEVVLLYKSKQPRPDDARDFYAVFPLLLASQRAWLAASLEAVEPGHLWLSKLAM